MENPDSKLPLAGTNIRDIAKTFETAGFDAYDPARILLHYYRHRSTDIQAIDCYPKKLRQFLKEVYSTDLLQPLFNEKSFDGTEKWLFKTIEGYPFETAWIPDQNRQTICLSTQSGCRFGCKFCMTGSLGFQAQLSAFEILSQLLAIDKPFTHIVFMGMGEPLDNYDVLSHIIEILTAHWGFSIAARYITVSTVGLLPTLERLGKELTCNIAISLHSPFPDQRAEIIPAERRYPIKEIISVIEKIEFKRKRRLSFEYLLINGYNDSKEHAAGLGFLISHLPAHVNLIPYNYIPKKPYKTTSLKDVETFRQELNKFGLRVTIRKSRGYDISAACGMMAGRVKLTHKLLNQPKF